MLESVASHIGADSVQEAPELSPFDVYPDATHEITHSQGPGSSDDSTAVPAASGEPATETSSPKASGGAAALGSPHSCRTVFQIGWRLCSACICRARCTQQPCICCGRISSQFLAGCYAAVGSGGSDTSSLGPSGLSTAATAGSMGSGALLAAAMLQEDRGRRPLLWDATALPAASHTLSQMCTV